MKHLLTIGLALTLGLAGAATAQPTMTTRSHMTPNGAVHTTTRVDTNHGTAVTRTVDRPDGTRRVVQRTRTSYNHGRHTGWERGRHNGWRHAGWNRNRVCRTEWRHHERVRRCWTRRR